MAPKPKQSGQKNVSSFKGLDEFVEKSTAVIGDVAAVQELA